MAPGRPILRLDPDAKAADLAGAADRAIAVLEAGGTVIVPTDTVYGLAAHPERPDGIERLFAGKARDRSKALAVLAADPAQARGLLDVSVLGDEPRRAVETMMATAWPGGLTVVGPRVAHWRHVDLGGDATTIGVRVPHAPIVRAIATRIGPVVTTSANRSGQPTPTDAAAAARSLADDVGLVIDSGPGGGMPSTVVDVTTTPFRVLRRGTLDPAALGVDPEKFEPAGTVRSGGRRE